MKSQARFFACLGAVGMFLLFFPGCYTQMGASRGEDERGGDQSYQPQGQGQYPDSSYSEQGERRDYDDSNNGYYGYDNQYGSRPYYGFSYYYPSTYWPSYAFNAAYYDPWAFNIGFGYSYNPYAYNYAGYYSPYYPYGYYPSYGYAYNSHGTSYYRLHHGGRTFGDTRGVSSGGRGTTIDTHSDVAPPPVVNTDRGGYNFPTGARMSATPTGGNVQTPAPASVNQRPAAPRGSAAVRGGSRSGNGRSTHSVRAWGGRRVAAPAVPRGDTEVKGGGRETQAAPAAPPTRTNGGGRDAGVQRGSAPAPRPAAPASTPPSGGRNGGSRGGRDGR